MGVLGCGPAPDVSGRSRPLSGSEREFEYRADLRDTALPEMLYTVDRFQVPGVLEAERDEVVKRVFIREGNVVHASSSDRNDSLGAYLQRTGKITADQFTETMRLRSEDGGKRYGELMIEAGLIAPAAIYEAIRKQIEAIVWSLFYWQEGEVRFQIGSFQVHSGARIQLPMRQVILQGIKRAPNAKALVARMGTKETVFEACCRTEDLIEAALDADEYRLLKLVDGRRSLYEICTQGPLSPAENAKLVYAFQVLRLIRRQEAKSAAVSEAPASGRSQAQAPGAAGAEASPAAVGGRKVIKIRFKTAGDRFGK